MRLRRTVLSDKLCALREHPSVVGPQTLVNTLVELIWPSLAFLGMVVAVRSTTFYGIGHFNGTAMVCVVQ
jgi:hypothetical protein